MALVDFQADGGIATLTLNNPPVNGYSYEMMQELDAAILKARFDASVHVLVLTGNGEKFFCAGANIAMLSRVDETFKYYFCLHANETLLRLENTPKLCIAALNGHCVGGGLEVALACDVRIGRTGPFKVGLPEVALGVLPGTGGTQRLARLLGRSAALRLMIQGDTVDFVRGQSLGLIDELLDSATHADFMAEVRAYAARYLPPGKAPLAVGRIKRAVLSGADQSLEQGLALERELQAELFASKDAKEGLTAYTEKRKAIFRGA